MERVTWGRIQNPVRGMLHGSAAVASVIGLVVLLTLDPGNLSVAIALGIYTGSLVLMYTLSSLYHCVPWSERWKRRMRKLDHAGIFLVVAGTYTPIGVIALDGTWRIATLAAVWAAAGVGIVVKMLESRVRLGVSAAIQHMMGWAAIIPLIEVSRRLGGGIVVWVALGGIFYTIGTVVLLTRRPRLAPRVFGYHELFHLLVIAGSVAHFLGIATLVIPAAG